MAIVKRLVKGSPLTHAELDNNFEELDKIPNGKTFPKNSDIGIKIDVDDPDWGWMDMEGYVDLMGGQGTYQLYRGNIKQIQLQEGQDAYVSFHVPHDYVPGSELYIHIHWSHASTGVTGGTVTWVFETTYSKGHNQAYFIEPVNISVVDDASAIQYQHRIAETVATTPGGSAVLLDTNQIEVDGIIITRLYLDSNDILTSDASTVHPFVHFVDLHYQSNGLPTKNKAPNFYN
jgi:hypothetical protein